jgi:hypothetical protein
MAAAGIKERPVVSWPQNAFDSVGRRQETLDQARRCEPANSFTCLLVGGQVPDWHLLAVYWMTPEMQKAHDLAVAGSQNFRASEAIN